MISFVVFSLRRAWQGFWRNAVMSLAATATMVLMLLLLAGFWIVLTGLNGRPRVRREKVEVVADVKPTATDPADRRPDRAGRGAARGGERRRTSTRTRPSRRFQRAAPAQGREDLTEVPRHEPAARLSIEVKLKDPKVFGNVVESSGADPSSSG